MRRHLLTAPGGRRFTPATDVAVCVFAIALMLVGAVMIFTGPNAGIAFALIAIGTSLVAIIEMDKRRGRRAAH
jgi:hypothetical protein